MRTSLPRNALRGRDAGWCLRANRWGEWQGVRRFFAVISRLGDGVFWYVLMGALIVMDGLDGLAASAHLAATGVIALTLYKLLKRWTRRPRPFASPRPVRGIKEADTADGIGRTSPRRRHEKPANSALPLSSQAPSWACRRRERAGG